MYNQKHWHQTKSLRSAHQRRALSQPMPVPIALKKDRNKKAQTGICKRPVSSYTILYVNVFYL